MKPTVRYWTNPLNNIQVGHQAVIQPFDHPSELVSNKKPVLTSMVECYNRVTGVFETENTIYVPIKGESNESCC